MNSTPSPVVTTILSNLKKIKLKYQGSEKAYKLRDYIQECYNKLKAKQRDDLVVELREAIKQDLEYAKSQAATAERQRQGYLRGPAGLSDSFDNPGQRSAGDAPSDPRAGERRLPF
jgi:hypothetical protein